MACRCDCCKGACCYEFAGEPTCSFQSCADCEELGGQFQGPGTECTGEDSNVCPCDPPADHLQCEKCASGAPADRCQEGQYCCDGVCQDEPCCECACPNICGYEIVASMDELTTSAEATATPTDCESCAEEDTDTVSNPINPSDQSITLPNDVTATASNIANSGEYVRGEGHCNEGYYYPGTTETGYARNGSATARIYCSVVDGAVQWRVVGEWSVLEQDQAFDTTSFPFVLTKDRYTSLTRSADVAVALEACGETPNITVVVGKDSMTVNGTSYSMTTDALIEACDELVGGSWVTCQDYLDPVMDPVTVSMTWTGDCDGPCDTPPP